MNSSPGTLREEFDNAKDSLLDVRKKLVEATPSDTSTYLVGRIDKLTTELSSPIEPDIKTTRINDINMQAESLLTTANLHLVEVGIKEDGQTKQKAGEGA